MATFERVTHHSRFVALFVLAACGCGDTTHASTGTEPADGGGAPWPPLAGGGGTGGTGGASGGGGAEPPQICVDDELVNQPPLPDYTTTGAVLGSHCLGTDHQDVTGVERIVFLGDSLTVGTPPTLAKNTYRAKLADTLATLWGLPAPGLAWRIPNPLTGQSSKLEDGPFASCAQWGARARDILGEQVGQCFSGDDFDRRTLVVMTVGGNDVQDATKMALDGAPPEVVTARVDEMTADMDAAVRWLVEPGRFSAGVFVVFANLYEFTDRTGLFDGCDVSGLVGFDAPLPAPDEVFALLDQANLSLMTLAAETETDLVLSMEIFCGHGVQAENPAAPCYRGPGTARWFDLTCIHPNRDGHEALASSFAQVVAGG